MCGTHRIEPPTTEVAGFLLHRPLPLLVLHGFHRRNFRQFLPYKLRFFVSLLLHPHTLHIWLLA